MTVDLTKPTFYAPQAERVGDVIVLRSDERQHLQKVLRLGPGGIVRIVNGAGGAFAGQIRSGAELEIELTSIADSPKEIPIALTLCMAVLRNRNRFEFAIEKSVELGVTAIVPLVTHRCEKQRVSNDRLLRVVESAMKQCGRSILPRIDAIATVEEIIDLPGKAVVCHEKQDNSLSFDAVQIARTRPDIIRLCIGPEGGFTDEEIVLFERAGSQVVSLGETRLRSETAAIAAMVKLRTTIENIHE